MGCYVNPKETTKEQFLAEHGTSISAEEAEITSTHLPVCLVDNGWMKAAGVAFDEREMEAFKYPDQRPKEWFMVSREELRKVSDLTDFE